MLPTTSGIYLIRNTENGKIYIGQAKGEEGIAGRKKSHLKSLRRGTASSHLQNAWDKYGEQAFIFEVLHLCPPNECDYWEDFYLTQFESWKRDNGYNIEKLSRRGPGSCSEETRLKISAANKGKVYGPRPEEVKRLISERRKAVGNKPRTPEMNIKNGNSHRGTKHKQFTEGAKQKLSEIHKQMRWITNGEKSTQQHKDKPLPEGWWFGRK